MKTLIEKFPEQLKQAVEIAKNTTLKQPNNKIENVYISGLGGSGIGGTIASELAFDNAEIPIVVGKGYFIPAFVNKNTLVIVSSYSGNTEETVQAMNAALEKGAHIVAVTSGGMVEETAKQKNFDAIVVPGGMPPRACFGYSLTQVNHILFTLKVIKSNPLPDFLAAADLLIQEKENIIAEAKKLTAFFKNKIPVIYSTTSHEGIAIRWRQQINENAKMLCWHHVVPEMNHNELVGWRKENDQLAVLYLLFNDEYERNLKRIEINSEVIKKYTPNILTLVAKGKSAIEQTLYLSAISDFTSIFLADENGVEAIEIDVINNLKNALSKF